MKRGPRSGSLEQYKSTNHPGQLTPSASHIYTLDSTVTHTHTCTCTHIKTHRSEDCQYAVEGVEFCPDKTHRSGSARKQRLCFVYGKQCFGAQNAFSQTSTCIVSVLAHTTVQRHPSMHTHENLRNTGACRLTSTHALLCAENQTHMLMLERTVHVETHAHTHTHTCIHKSVFGNVTFSQKPPFPALSTLPLWLCED